MGSILSSTLSLLSVAAHALSEPPPPPRHVPIVLVLKPSPPKPAWYKGLGKRV